MAKAQTQSLRDNYSEMSELEEKTVKCQATSDAHSMVREMQIQAVKALEDCKEVLKNSIAICLKIKSNDAAGSSDLFFLLGKAHIEKLRLQDVCCEFPEVSGKFHKENRTISFSHEEKMSSMESARRAFEHGSRADQNNPVC